jgi:hypothetical protein
MEPAAGLGRILKQESPVGKPAGLSCLRRIRHNFQLLVVEMGFRGSGALKLTSVLLPNFMLLQHKHTIFDLPLHLSRKQVI